MAEPNFEDIWKRQCDAARSIRDNHGVVPALDYLIGEKLQTYAETAAANPKFARGLPSFVAAVRGIFSPEEIGHYLDHLERMAAIDDEQEATISDDDVLRDTPEQIAVRRGRLAVLKELLTTKTLGTA